MCHRIRFMNEKAINKAFGVRLKEERARSSITQDELAKRAGIGRTTVANIERGRQSVSIPVLYRLASALGVSPEVLLPKSVGMGVAEDGSAYSENLDLSDRQNTWVRNILQESRNDEK